MNCPLVSVVIPTYNRGRVACETLSHLFQQDYPAFETIVVDQSKKTQPVVEQFYRDNAHRVRYYRLERPALPYARNYGIKAARGAIVLFLDDDIIPVSGQLIANHARHYSDPALGGVAGGVLLKGGTQRRAVKKVGTLRRVDLKYEHNYDSDAAEYVDIATGCNMSFRRDVLITVNGFSDLFTRYIYLDDSDVSIRVRKRGHRIIFDPEAAIVHLEAEGGDRRSAEEPYNKSYRMFHNEALFYFKNLNPIFFPLFFIQEIRRIIIRSRRTEIYRFYPALKGLLAGCLKGFKLLLHPEQRGGNLDSVETDPRLMLR